MIIWFILFHLGIDFWLFPNYFIDSNNPLDSFVPFLEVSKRDDILDLRMLVLRLASVAAIVYGAREIMSSDRSMDDVVNTFQDLSNDVFEWGQNKFLGIPDNSQALQHKKSAREIFAEAFMEDDMMRTNTRFVEYADEAELKAAYEKELKARMAAAELEVEVENDLDSENGNVDVLESLTRADDDENHEDAAEAEGVNGEGRSLLDSLTQADDEDEEEEALTTDSPAVATSTGTQVDDSKPVAVDESVAEVPVAVETTADETVKTPEPIAES